MVKWLPIAIMAATALFGLVDDNLKALIAADPTASLIVAAVAGMLASIAPSPGLKGKPAPPVEL